MGIITDLKSRFEALVKNSSDISSVIHSELENINADSKNSYPLVIWDDTDFDVLNPRNKYSYIDQTIDLRIFDTYHQGSKGVESIANIKDRLREDLITLIHSLPDRENDNRQNTFEVIRFSEGRTGWNNEHNDDLVAARLVAVIRGFYCISKTDVPA